jgi:hypothetical protein
MIYVKLRNVKFPATVTNKRSHVSKGLVDDYKLKNMKQVNFWFRICFQN